MIGKGSIPAGECGWVHRSTVCQLHEPSALEIFPFAHVRGYERWENCFGVCDGNRVLVQRSDGPSSQPRGASIEWEFQRPPDEKYTCLAFSIEPITMEPILAAGCRGGVVDIFDLRTGKLRGMLTGHGNMIYDLKFSPSHPHVMATASLDLSINLWNVAGIGVPAHVSSRKRAASPAPNPLQGRRFAVFAGDGGHRRGVLSIDFHPEMPILISADMAHTVKIWAIPDLPAEPLEALKSRGFDFASICKSLQSTEVETIHYPLFTSSSIHPEWTWIEKVHFLSNDVVISMARKTRDEGSEKEVVFWRPKVFEDVYAVEPRPTSTSQQPDQNHMEPPEVAFQESSLDYEVLAVADLEPDSVISLHRPWTPIRPQPIDSISNNADLGPRTEEAFIVSTCRDGLRLCPIVQTELTMPDLSGGPGQEQPPDFQMSLTDAGRLPSRHERSSATALRVLAVQPRGARVIISTDASGRVDRWDLEGK